MLVADEAVVPRWDSPDGPGGSEALVHRWGSQGGREARQPVDRNGPDPDRYRAWAQLDHQPAAAVARPPRRGHALVPQARPVWLCRAAAHPWPGAWPRRAGAEYRRWPRGRVWPWLRRKPPGQHYAEWHDERREEPTASRSRSLLRGRQGRGDSQTRRKV